MRAELAKRDDFVRRAFEDTAVSMVVTTADLVIERANQAFCDLLGYTAAELRGTSMADITHPDDRAMIVTAIGQLRSGELRRFTGEKRYRSRDGATVRAQIGISPVLNAAGEVTSFISQILDVTEQRAVEAALRETGELFRAAFEDVEAGMMLVAPDGRIVHGNASLCELLGYTPEELRQLDVVALTHPDDRERTREALAALASGELNSHTVEKRYLRKSGEAVWAQEIHFDRPGLERRFDVHGHPGERCQRAAPERGALPAAVRVEPAGDGGCRRERQAPAGQRRARGDPRLRRRRAGRPQVHGFHAPGRLRGRSRPLHRADGRPADALRAREAIPPAGRRAGLGAHDRVRASQSRRRPPTRDRHARGHHRAPRARGSASPVPAHGGGRATRRRSRARLQQPPYCGHELLRSRLRCDRGGQRSGSARQRGRNPRRGQPGRRGDPAASCLQSPAGARAEAARPQLRRHRPGRPAPAPARRRRQRPPRARARHSCSDDGRGSACAGGDEPRRQRARCDAGRRDPHHRDAERRSRPRSDDDGHRERAARAARRQRHRLRDGRGDARADLRAVLHDEGAREGHRSGTVHRAGDHRTVGRPRQRLQRAGHRHDVQGVHADGRRVPGASEHAPEVAPTERPVGTGLILLVEDNDAVRKPIARLLSDFGYEVVPADGPRRRCGLLRGGRSISSSPTSSCR